MEKNNKKIEPPIIPSNFVTIAQLKQRWITQQQQQQTKQNVVIKNDSVPSGSKPGSPKRPVNSSRRAEKFGDKYPKPSGKKKKNKEVKAREENSGSESHAPLRENEERVPGEVIVERKVLTVDVGKLSLSEGRSGGNVRVVNRSRGIIPAREERGRGGRQGGGGGSGMVWVKKGGACEEKTAKFRSSSGLSIGHRD